MIVVRMCIITTVFLLQRNGGTFCCEPVYVYKERGFERTLHRCFCSHGWRWTIGYLHVNTAIWFQYIFELFWNFVFLGGFEWIYTSPLDTSTSRQMSRWIQLQMDDFILILFLIFLVESGAGFIQVFGSITSNGPLPYSISTPPPTFP